MGHRLYRPLRLLLAELHHRYDRPLLLTETGADEGNAPGWLRYVAGEVRAVLRSGVPVQGICLYPITDYPAWTGNRHCRCGLLRLGPDWQARTVDSELLEQIQEEDRLLRAMGVTTIA